jgi:hypothetical protein
MQHFNRVTTDTFNENIVVMGKNTWLSLKEKLDNRINIVISKTLKDEKCDAIYDTLDDFIKDYYDKDNIFIIGRQQEKEGTEIVGYNFIINVEKSRYVKEKSKIPVTVSFNGGISKWSGLLDIALESGHVIKPSNGWYSKVNVDTGEIEDKKCREKDTDTKDFWMPILKQKSFRDYIENKYRVASGDIIQIEKEVIEDENI